MHAAGTPLSDWLARLETLSPVEIDLGLERVTRVLDRLVLSRPATVLHVGGTNGKGSSVAMLESLFHASGACVGAFTSPHVRRYNERIRVAGEEAQDDQIVSAFERIEAVREDEALTYFEYGTLAAIVVFAEAGVDTAILEVGMGGRLDAVNAVEPDAGIITNIALDHCDWLGDDVEAIASEKAGIMREHKPIVFASRDLPQAIAKTAATVGARLIAAGRDYDWSVDDSTWSWRGAEHRLDALAMPSLPGEHQLANAAGVLALIEALGRRDLLQTRGVNACLTRLRLQGRMQSIAADPRWLFDVAHNPAAAEALGKVLRADPRGQKTVAIIATLDDKDVEGIAAPLASCVSDWIAVTADSPRAIGASELARRVANTVGAACLVAESLDEALERAEELTDPSDRILVTGSFYLVGPALQRLQ